MNWHKELKQYWNKSDRDISNGNTSKHNNYLLNLFEFSQVGMSFIHFDLGISVSGYIYISPLSILVNRPNYSNKGSININIDIKGKLTHTCAFKCK